MSRGVLHNKSTVFKILDISNDSFIASFLLIPSKPSMYMSPIYPFFYLYHVEVPILPQPIMFGTLVLCGIVYVCHFEGCLELISLFHCVFLI